MDGHAGVARLDGIIPALESATGTIISSTAVGRATVARLQLNTPTELAARRQWMRLRLLPLTG